jgi:phosphoribosylformylglycinamidine synthase II
VPTRQENMKAWEMLLSESQERMLIVIEKGKEAEVQAIFDKWDIHCEQIGVVTKDPRLKYFLNGELMADVPAESLVLGGGAPVYERETKEPAYFDKVNAFNQNDIPEASDLQTVARQIIQLPNIASKRWVYEQYDSMVGTANASTNAPTDAAIVRLHGTDKALAVTVDCNSRYVFLNPYVGGMIAVSEAARNIVCSGGQPVAITNCLNFGNPYNPEVYYQFVHALRGMSDACLKFDTPVTGGNVSFYNQSEDGPVYPTPTIGMVGVLDSISNAMTLDFKHEGDTIYLLGTSRNDINGSEYLFKLHNVTHSPAPHFDLEEEARLQQLVASLISNKLIASAHDVTEGGLFATLAESAFPGNLGFNIQTAGDIRKDAFLFGEAQSRVVVSVAAGQESAFEAAIGQHPYSKLGTVTNGSIIVDGSDWGQVTEWKNQYDNAIQNELS